MLRWEHLSPHLPTDLSRSYGQCLRFLVRSLFHHPSLCFASFIQKHLFFQEVTLVSWRTFRWRNAFPKGIVKGPCVWPTPHPPEPIGHASPSLPNGLLGHIPRMWTSVKYFMMISGSHQRCSRYLPLWYRIPLSCRSTELAPVSLPTFLEPIKVDYLFYRWGSWGTGR